MCLRVCVYPEAGAPMKRSINAALVGRFAVVSAVVCTGVIGFSCSPAGKDSTVSGDGPGAGAASSGGSGATGGGTAGSKMGGPDLGPNVPGMSPAEACQGLECQVQACTPGVSTTITGKVFAPNGTLPLYNVLVYVPNPTITPVPAFTAGAACDRCGASVLNPVTSAITDETGTFKLEKAPSGENIPLVIQVGKWRRQITIPSVAPCVDTPLADPQLTRLPKNKTEGDIPLIAIAAGGADQMECLPRRLGIEDTEFSSGTGDGRIHLYSGQNEGANRPILSIDATLPGAGTLAGANTLWGTVDSLQRYDIVILSCEGQSYPMTKPMAARQALYDYAALGGRVFASHWHNVWFEDGPAPLPTTGTWNTRMPNPAGDTGNAVPAVVDQSFPKGEALAKWLVNVGASTMPGHIDVVYPRDNIQAVNPAIAREWIAVDNPNFPAEPKAVQYMSFNTPIGVPEEQVCGREVYTNLHVAAVDSDPNRNQTFPVACEVRDLTAQEKVVAFMLFDLSACVMNDDLEPKPPH
jgi:hypothetical protein